MLTKLMSALCFFVFALSTNAQNNVDTKTAMALAINAEQMLNKAGFENLLNVMFSDKNNSFNETEKQKIRKGVAALYGAGIDFDKKIWFIANNTTLKSSSYSRYGIINPFKNYEAAMYIPIANRQVVEKAIADISGNNIENWEEKYGNKYIYLDEALLVINNSAFAIIYHNKSYNNYDRYRIILKTDTIKTTNANNDYNSGLNNDQETKEKADLNYIVDKVETNGMVTRVLKYKQLANIKDNYNYPMEATNAAADTMASTVTKRAAIEVNKKSTNTNKTIPKKPTANKNPNKVVVAAATDVKVMDQVYEAPPYKATKGYSASRVAANSNFKHKRNVRDTLYDTDYINPNTKVKITYFNCNNNERDSIDALIKIADDKDKELFIDKALISLKQPMPWDESKDNAIKQIQEAKNDMYLYINGAIFNNYYGLNPFMEKFNVANEGMNTSSFVNTLDFESGKITLQNNTNYSAELLKRFANFYFPLNNNWPANFGSRSKGQMQVNVNVPKVLEYYKNIYHNAGALNVFKIMEDKGFKADEISDAFTGEMFAFVDTKTSEREYKRKENNEDPYTGLALGVRNTKIAVALLNKMASLSKSMPQYYAFDKTGKYLIFLGSVNSKIIAEDLAVLIDSKVLDKEMITLSGNDFGKLQFNLKGFIKAIFGNNMEGDKPTSFFVDKLNMLNMNLNRIEDGNYHATITMDCGDAKQNPLAVFVELAKISIEEAAANDAKYKIEEAQRQKARDAQKNKRPTPTKRKK